MMGAVRWTSKGVLEGTYHRAQVCAREGNFMEDSRKHNTLFCRLSECGINSIIGYLNF